MSPDSCPRVMPGLSAKRLELLREARARVLAARRARCSRRCRRGSGRCSAAPPATRRLGLDTRIYEVRSAGEVEATLAAVRRDGVQALYVSPISYLHSPASRDYCDWRRRMRLPTIYFFREFVQAGGLMSYGTDLTDMYRRAATYVGQDSERRQSRRPAAADPRTSMSWPSTSRPRRRLA